MPDPTSMQPDDRLTELLDRHAVLDVLYTYVDRVDALDIPAMMSLFLPDATADLLGTRCEGAKAIGRQLGRALGGFDATSHHVTNPLIRVETPDRATVSASVYAWHLRRSSQSWDFYGRYLVELRRTDGDWRMTHLALVGIGGGPDATPQERALYTGHPDRSES